MQIRFTTNDLNNEQVLVLLQEHVEHMRSTSPPESTHALDIDALRTPAITFWSAWNDNNELLGCAALKALDSTAGEIKSMRTAEPHLRKGVAGRMLEHVITEARNRDYKKLYLETGSMPEFLPARQLYTRYGFEFTQPFADYAEDPNSVFMVLRIN